MAALPAFPAVKVTPGFVPRYLFGSIPSFVGEDTIRMVIDIEKSGNRPVPFDEVVAVGIVIGDSMGNLLMPKLEWYIPPPDGTNVWGPHNTELNTWNEFWAAAGFQALTFINASLTVPRHQTIQSLCVFLDNLDEWAEQNKLKVVVESNCPDTDCEFLAAWLRHVTQQENWRAGMHTFRYGFPSGRSNQINSAKRRLYSDPGERLRALVPATKIKEFKEAVSKFYGVSHTHRPADDAHFVYVMGATLRQLAALLHNADEKNDATMLFLQAFGYKITW